MFSYEIAYKSHGFNHLFGVWVLVNLYEQEIFEKLNYTRAEQEKLEPMSIQCFFSLVTVLCQIILLNIYSKLRCDVSVLPRIQ